jgi:hypothetical protein
VNFPDKLIGLLIGLPLGVVVTWVWYELSGTWPRWIRGVGSSEYTEDFKTTMICPRCNGEGSFVATTVAGGLEGRISFVQKHRFCEVSIDDQGRVL